MRKRLERIVNHRVNHIRLAEERLRLFLIQHWGGPALYAQLRGQPQLGTCRFGSRGHSATPGCAR
ncbi:MAG: hypothetical protein ACRDKY_11195 [Solirubrobacteraceae bacterium]